MLGVRVSLSASKNHDIFSQAVNTAGFELTTSTGAVKKQS